MNARSLLRDPAVWLLALGAGLLYGPLVPELVRDWSENADFSHGFAVPPVAAWLLWHRRDRIRDAVPRAWWPGAFVLAFAILQYLVGVAGSEFYLQRTSLIPFLAGWILLVWGPERARPFVFPVAFLLFMIPPPTLLWSSLSLPLQLLASKIAAGALTLGGLEVVRAGNVLHLPHCSLEVAGACSGLRSLITLLALGAVIAEGSLLGPGGPRRPVFRWLLFLGAVPVAVAVNVVRVSLTALAAARISPTLATGWIHEASGLLMFTLSLALLWLGRSALAWIDSSGSWRPS